MKKYIEFKASSKPDRIKHVEEHDYRSPYQRDRDRILYSKEFRRLEGKTQVFVDGFDDNMRTRLTHTLQVAQIANTISEALGLDIYLTEAIALGHDVGHTPFGHVGERTLNAIMNGCISCYEFNESLDEKYRGFKHNLQSVRVVSFLEKINLEEPSLNLTRYTLWGLANHTKTKCRECDRYNSKNQKCTNFYNEISKCPNQGKLSLGYYENTLKNGDQKLFIDERDWTFEAIVVALADEIAQRQHDIEDGIYAGVLNKSEVIAKYNKIFNKYTTGIDLCEEEIDNKVIISIISKNIVELYVGKAIGELAKRMDTLTDEFSIKSSEDFLKNKESIYKKYVGEGEIITDIFGFDRDFNRCDKEFREYLNNRILKTELAQKMDGKATYIIRKIVKAYLTNPQQLPDKTIKVIVEDYLLINKNDSIGDRTDREFLENKLKEEDYEFKMVLLRRVCDYIAGMTDRYAESQYERLYGLQ